MNASLVLLESKSPAFARLRVGAEGLEPPTPSV